MLSKDYCHRRRVWRSRCITLLSAHVNTDIHTGFFFLSASCPNKPLNEAGDLFLPHTPVFAGACLHAHASHFFVALLCVEQASGSNLPLDKNTARHLYARWVFWSLTFSFSPAQASRADCELSCLLIRRQHSWEAVIRLMTFPLATFVFILHDLLIYLDR